MRLNIFRIPVPSNPGIQEYDFEVEESFFRHFEDGEISSGRVKVTARILKSDRQIRLDLNLAGSVDLVCDRCLDDYQQVLDSNYVLYGKFGHAADQEDLDVFRIPENAAYIDLLPVLYEYIILSLPLKRIHPLDSEGNSLCNSEMIRRLEELNINPAG